METGNLLGKMTEVLSPYDASGVIVAIRGQRVIIDADLARIYGVPTKALNQAVKRNRERFPVDFMFQITQTEFEALRRSSLVISQQAGNRSQSVTGSQKHRNPRLCPYAFTEHGAIMAATVLNSPQAVEMSVFVVRAFVKMREQLLTSATLTQRLAEVENTLLTHDTALRDLYQQLRPLLLPPPEPPRKQIGFGVKERRASYRTKRVTKS